MAVATAGAGGALPLSALSLTPCHDALPRLTVASTHIASPKTGSVSLNLGSKKHSQVIMAGPQKAQSSSGSTTSGTTKRAFISVYDRSRLDFLANGLKNLGYTIVSSGGTARALEDYGFPAVEIEQLDASADYVLSYHALQKRNDPEEILNDYGFGTFDVVAVNMFCPESSDKFEGKLEDINIMGSTMISVAAKNFKDVLVVVDPKDYNAVLEFLLGGRCDERQFRMKLAAKAFQHVAAYDTTVCASQQQS